MKKTVYPTKSIDITVFIDIVDKNAIVVRSFETGIEYFIPYKEEWVVKPIPTNEDNDWNFCPHCGKKLR